MLVSCFLLFKYIYQIYREDSLVIKKKHSLISDIFFKMHSIKFFRYTNWYCIAWKKCHLFVGRNMVKKINLPYIVTVFLTYFLATVIISAIKEETVISLKSKNAKKLEKFLRVELIIHNIKTRKLSQPSKKKFPSPILSKEIVSFSGIQNFQRPELAKIQYIKKNKTSSTAAFNYKSYIWWWSSR